MVARRSRLVDLKDRAFSKVVVVPRCICDPCVVLQLLIVMNQWQIPTALKGAVASSDKDQVTLSCRRLRLKRSEYCSYSGDLVEVSVPDWLARL